MQKETQFKKAIWLITGGVMQYIVAQKIKAMGFSLILSDRNDQAACVPLADLFFQIDTFDQAGHLTACETAQKQFDIAAVMTFAADCHPTVSAVAAHLKLHGIDPEISTICRDKAKTRQVLTKAGIAQPIFFETHQYDDAISFLKNNSDKAFVLKASDSSGSRGFQVLPQGNILSLTQFQYTQRYCSKGNVIIEERLFPDENHISEASVETIWIEGKMYWINWVDRIFSRDLIFFPSLTLPFPLADGIEVGHVNPAMRDFNTKKTVENMIYQAGIALGMHLQSGSHLLKADIYFSTRGPIILELTPRSSGGWDSSGSSPTRGADMAGGVIRMALNEIIDLDAWYRYFHYHDAQRKVVVLSHIPEGAVDCIGRQFTLVSGYEDTQLLIEKAFQQLEAKQYVSI